MQAFRWLRGILHALRMDGIAWRGPTGNLSGLFWRHHPVDARVVFWVMGKWAAGERVAVRVLGKGRLAHAIVITGDA